MARTPHKTVRFMRLAREGRGGIRSLLGSNQRPPGNYKNTTWLSAGALANWANRSFGKFVEMFCQVYAFAFDCLTFPKDFQKERRIRLQDAWDQCKTFSSMLKPVHAQRVWKRDFWRWSACWPNLLNYVRRILLRHLTKEDVSNRIKIPTRFRLILLL